MILRVARHTDNLTILADFYTKILGLVVLGDFRNHETYHGIFLGYANQGWHLEFTQSEKKANHTFDKDDLLVFYPRDPGHLEQILSNIKSNYVDIHEPENPYWKTNGTLIKDPDGYGIIITNPSDTSVNGRT